MLSIVLSLFVGWLLHFIGLNGFFHTLLGFNDQIYYSLWFVLGFVNALKNITHKGEK